ncbi:MAG: non-canonical purine NTP pyrophosphatase [Spirochaetaceae bacterium]|jgi:XTP/dITP diphosphohydrolase|nr:non-canonical purine NTP pyrophosphatase [Spirochaetaceae bacterium]
MEIFLASNNAHKHRELAPFFPGAALVLPRDRGIPFGPEETGNTFGENCLLKARSLYALVKAPVLADDSGLCVDILGGAPGIYTSRYGGKDFPRGLPGGAKLPQEEQNRLLIEHVNEALRLNPDGAARWGRSCRFVCALALYLGDDRFVLVQETMEGLLVETPEAARGAGGFGYDPVVVVQGLEKTAAELAPEEKKARSHRGRAARRLSEFFKNEAVRNGESCR